MDKPNISGGHSIILEGTTIQYTLKRSPYAKHVRLEIKTGSGLAVIVPRRYQVKRLPDILKAKQKWILRHYPALEDRQRGEECHFGDSIQYLGESLQLVRGHAAPATRAILERTRLVLYLPVTASLDSVLEGWYRAQAKRLVSSRAQELSLRMGVEYARITIRGQKTRWASCSRKGNLSFNWRLIRLPEAVIDYVVIHELVHLKEMNHSARFWSLVARHCPSWREQRAFLRNHEASLYAYR